MHNRRNLYRLLHVQRDAPTAVIKSSYRTMMQTLRHHPDLGGDDWNAALLNEAMATLGDPVSRAAYDESQFGDASERGRQADSSPSDPPRSEPRAERPEPSGAASPAGGTCARRATGDGRSAETAVVSPGAHCPFCRAPAAMEKTWPPRAAGYLVRRTACARCGGPTEPTAQLVASACTDRRHLHRCAHTGTATLWRRWPTDEPIGANLADLSIIGCALDVGFAFAPGDVILLETTPLTAIGEVRSCRPLADATRYRVGIAFLTVRARASPGALYAGTA